MTTTLRPASAADAGTIYRMICELENKKLDRAAFDSAFLTNLGHKNIRYLVAETRDMPVGMISCHVQWLLHHVAPVAEIQEMYVDPACRSQGIGRQLIAAIRHFAEVRGAVQLEVASNRSRHDAHRFYQREGFQKSHVKLVMKFQEIPLSEKYPVRP